MPPSAISILPLRRYCAPVKAPFSWPNSSLSSRLSGRAPQLTATIGEVPPLAVGVNRAGDDLLAGAALAQDQHRGVGLGHVLDQLQHLPHRRAVADDLVDGHQLVDRLAELRVLLAEPPLLQGPQDQMAEFVGIDRLGDVVEGALLQGPHRRVDRGEGGDHDHGRLRVDAAGCAPAVPCRPCRAS